MPFVNHPGFNGNGQTGTALLMPFVNHPGGAVPPGMRWDPMTNQWVPA